MPTTNAEAANALNKKLEKFMPFLTPLGVALGLVFPTVFSGLRPAVTLLFAAMTLSGALKLRTRDLANTIKQPLPILLFFFSAHILMPVLVFLICSVVFRADTALISGYVLFFAVPTAVSGFVWVSIYRGDAALSLTLILLDTLAAPFVVPGTVALLLGTAVTLDMTGIAVSLVFMVLIPTIIGITANELSRGKLPSLVSPYLNPFSKLCLVLVVAANASAVTFQFDPKLLVVAIACIIFTGMGFCLAKLTGIVLRLNRAKRVSLFFEIGIRNISAATTIAIAFFPPAAAMPCLLGILFQQVLAALMGKWMMRDTNQE